MRHLTVPILHGPGISIFWEARGRERANEKEKKKRKFKFITLEWCVVWESFHPTSLKLSRIFVVGNSLAQNQLLPELRPPQITLSRWLVQYGSNVYFYSLSKSYRPLGRDSFRRWLTGGHTPQNGCSQIHDYGCVVECSLFQGSASSGRQSIGRFSWVAPFKNCQHIDRVDQRNLSTGNRELLMKVSVDKAGV